MSSKVPFGPHYRSTAARAMHYPARVSRAANGKDGSRVALSAFVRNSFFRVCP